MAYKLYMAGTLTVNKKKVLTTFTVVSIFGEINAELGVEI